MPVSSRKIRANVRALAPATVHHPDPLIGLNPHHAATGVEELGAVVKMVRNDVASGVVSGEPDQRTHEWIEIDPNRLRSVLQHPMP